MEGNSQDKPGVIALPPLIYAVTLIMALLLDAAFPIRFLPGVLAVIIGWPLIGIATLLAVSALRAIHRAGTNVSPYKPTTALVVDGPFRFTRNPIYLAFTLLYGGIAILVNALWAVILLPVVLVVIHRGVIDREEHYLERKFGEQYLRYKARVRRWIGIPSKLA